MNITKVKKDNTGLFVISGGYVARPRQTSFELGNTVKANHVRGSQMVKVGKPETSFRGYKGDFETWWTTDLSPEVKKVMTHV